ncbi:MAG: DUF1554 domain-containing protein [Leptospiraceae bacterium]|nr:DUF1554 domain-containing protein [Leptospiraceae bacterium]
MNTYMINQLLLSISILLLSANCFLGAGVSSIDMEEKKDTTNCTLMFLLNSSDPLIPLLGNNDLCKYSVLSSFIKPPTPAVPQCASASTDTKCEYKSIEPNDSKENANVVPYDSKYSLYVIDGQTKDYDYDYYSFKPEKTETFFIKIIKFSIASTAKCFVEGIELTEQFKAYTLSSSTNSLSCYTSSYSTYSYYIVISKINLDRRIFTTQTLYNGKMGGIAGADAKCNSDTKRPDSSKTYKAILRDSYGVFKGNYDSYASYINLAGGLINSAVDVSPYPTQFTLSSSIDSASNGGYTWFGDKLNYAMECNAWSSSSSGVNGIAGYSSYTGSGWMTYSTQSCSTLSRIYCIEQ